MDWYMNVGILLIYFDKFASKHRMPFGIGLQTQKQKNCFLLEYEVNFFALVTRVTVSCMSQYEESYTRKAESYSKRAPHFPPFFRRLSPSGISSYGHTLQPQMSWSPSPAASTMAYHQILLLSKPHCLVMSECGYWNLVHLIDLSQFTSIKICCVSCAPEENFFHFSM